ncbi:MAG: BrnT family toxin [Candidatus Woesebacteria bacterium]|nr:BrnT family toxin [Candidatus Woesebacteria bacterium]
MKLDFSNLVGFEWDSGNLKHINKHFVLDKECEEVFLIKPIMVSKDLLHSQIEKRYRVLGKTSLERKLNIVFTVRKNLLRIISARDQNKKEREKYRKKEVKYDKEKT